MSQAAVGGIELGRGHAQADLVQIDAVEFPAELDQRAVAVAAHIGDDGAHRLLDVLGNLALGGEESGKARGKVRGSAVEAYRHRALSGRDEVPVSPVNGPRRKARQPCLACLRWFRRPAILDTSIAWAGQHSVTQAGPRSASSASRHSTSSRSAAPPENVRVTTPAGWSVSSNETASRFRT